jgi:hypothetical protein
MHLSLRTIVTAARGAAVRRAVAAATLVAPLRAACGAALRILIATPGVELLIVSAKCELLAALDTGKGSIGISQVFQPSFMSLDNLRTELEDYGVQSKAQSVPDRY